MTAISVVSAEIAIIQRTRETMRAAAGSRGFSSSRSCCESLMAVDHRTETVVVAEANAGERLDRVLAATIADLSRSRLKALILAGEVAIGGRTVRDPGHRVNAGDTVAVALPPPEPATPAAGEHPAQHRVRGRRDHRHRQAARAGRASRRRQRHRHAGERADRPLRREPLRHRRRAPARHRAPARQGHHRADGGGEDRPRARQARRPVRRPWPHRAAPARLPRLRLGRARPAARHHRPADRPPPACPRQDGGARRAAARPSPIGRCWSASRGRTASRSRACSPAGWRPAAPTRSGSTWPMSATP